MFTESHVIRDASWRRKPLSSSLRGEQAEFRQPRKRKEGVPGLVGKC